MSHAAPRRALPVLLAALCLLTAGIAPARGRAHQAGPSRNEAPARHHYADPASLMRLVRQLSAPELEGRATGTPGGTRARVLIAEAFAALGLDPAGTEGYLQPFRFTLSADESSRKGRPRGTYSGANLVGLISGTVPDAPAFVATAHYDHLGRRNGRIYPGADDNASGVAALVAVADHFTQHPPRHPMVIAALDAEELGLRGARHFLARAPVPAGRIALNVNLDMVSRGSRNELFVAGTYHTPALLPLLRDVQRRSAVTLRFGHDRPAGSDGRDDWTTQSDHAVFHRRGIPFVYFGVEDHADYHEPTDTADRIDPAFFAAAVDTIIESLRVLDRRFAPATVPGER